MGKTTEERLQRRVERLERMSARQVDSINRLTGHLLTQDGQSRRTNPGIPPYEHELMHLNEQLALKDIRVDQLEGVLRRIRQSCRDRGVAWEAGSVAMGHPGKRHLDMLLEWIGEVMSDEGPRNVDAGRHDGGAPEAGSQTFEYVV